MLSRRVLTTLPVAVPLMGHVSPRLDIRDVRHEPLDVGATTILSISPDGGMLVGVQFRNRLCFMDATTLEVRALGEQIDELQLIDRASIHWSPDHSRIAFSLDAWRRMSDSDIFVAEVATAAMSNVTAEGHDDETASILDVSDVRIDLYPRWIDDDTLLFARHEVIDDGESTCEICTLAVESLVVKVLVPLHPLGFRFVISPPMLQTNGGMVMTLQGGDQPSEIVIAEPDGELTPVLIDGVQAPQLLDATDTRVLVWDVERFSLLIVPLDNLADATPFADIFGYGDGYQFIGRPAIASSPDAYVGVARSESSGKHRVFTMIAGERRDRGHLNGEVMDPMCHFAGSRMLISDYRNAWLIDVGS